MTAPNYAASISDYRRAKADYDAAELVGTDSEPADIRVVAAYQVLVDAPATTVAEIYEKLSVLLFEILDCSGGELERKHLQPVLDDLARLADMEGGAA